MMRLLLFMTCVLVLAVRPAYGYINTGYSLEWLCTFRSAVVYAEVVSVADLKTDDKGRHYEAGTLTCKTLETLKGKAEERLSFSTGAYTTLGQPGTKYLLFLDHDESRWPPSKEPVVVYAINLDKPATELSRGVAYTKAGAILTTSKEILDLAKERLAANAKRKLPKPLRQVGQPEHALFIEAPGESARALYAGSSDFLMIPPDPEFKALFLKRFRNRPVGNRLGVDDGLQSLIALSFYLDDPEVVTVVESALADAQQLVGTLRADSPEHPKAEDITCFPVRQLAYDFLVAAGHKPAQPDPYCRYLHATIHLPGQLGYSEFRDPKTGRALSFEEKKTPPATATRPTDTSPATTSAVPIAPPYTDEEAKKIAAKLSETK